MIIAAADNFGLSFILEVVGLIVVTTFVVKKFPGPLVLKLMNSKLTEIAAQLSAGEEAKKAAEGLVAERQRELDLSEAEARAIVEQARRGAELVATESVRQAEEEYERLVRRAAVTIEVARGATRAEVLAQVGRLVLTAATEVVEAELDATAQHRLIDEAISATEVEAR